MLNKITVKAIEMVPKYLLFIYFIAINVFPIFIYILQYYDYYFCTDCKKVQNNSIYDYIIIGSGSAGSIVAKRLGEIKNDKILVVEAGSASSSFLRAPSMGVLLQKTSFDWQYHTVPQKEACKGLNNYESKWPLGKIIGGSSQLNNMIYLRGRPEDYVTWFKGSNLTYNRDILPYIKKLENYLSIGTVPYSSDFQEMILKTVQSLNLTLLDNNLDCNLGFSIPLVNIKNGARATSSNNLFDHKYPNIFIHTHAFVEKILFKSNYEAYAVKFLLNKQIKYVEARKGIILSAGAINTPKILLLSGVGPKEDLELLKIPLTIDAPFVGKNLQDHLTTGLDLITINHTIGLGLSEMLSPFSVIEYFWNGNGPWTTILCEMLAFLRTNLKEDDKRPDLQFMFMASGVSEDNGVHLRHLIGLNDSLYHNYLDNNNLTTVSILPVLLHPKSRGTIKLSSKNPFDSPIIDPNYLSDPYDVKVLVKGLKWIEKFIKSDTMKQFGAKLYEIPFPGCEQFQFKTDSYWECYVRHFTLTSYHPIGTCKMGNSHDCVVDYNFQLKNTNKLFIVDGSILPTQSSGNINGPIMVLAEMASDQIKYSYYLSTKHCKLVELFIKINICYK